MYISPSLPSPSFWPSLTPLGTNFFLSPTSQKMAAMIFTKATVSTRPPKLRLLCRLECYVICPSSLSELQWGLKNVLQCLHENKMSRACDGSKERTNKRNKRIDAKSKETMNKYLNRPCIYDETTLSRMKNQKQQTNLPVLFVLCSACRMRNVVLVSLLLRLFSK